ncbi:MAG: hypothetical protein AAGJ18_02760 [Bacteroidota bacterium]
MASFHKILFGLITSLSLFLGSTTIIAQSTDVAPTENDYYKIITMPVPEDILIEAGGVCTLPSGSIAVSTRRGDVYIIDNPYMENGSTPRYRL